MKWVVLFICTCNIKSYKDCPAMPNNTKLLVKGDKAPEFIANTYNGSSIRLSRLLKVGPVVLIFIRSFS